MSLISYIETHGFISLISDLMISGPEENNHHTNFPNNIDRVKHFFPDGSGYIPKSMKQKTYIVRPNLCIGLAGSVIHSKVFLKDFILEFSYHEAIEAENIANYIGRYDSDIIRGISFIIILMSNGKSHHFISGFYEMSSGKIITKAISVGSGAKKFGEFIQKYNQLYNFENSGDFNIKDFAISTNFILMNEILLIDNLTGESILEYWGGGFEYIFYDYSKKEFVKLENFTTIHWRGIYDKINQDLSFYPVMINKYMYYKNLLLINCFNGKKAASYAVLNFIENQTIYDNEQKEINQLIYEYNSPYIASSFTFEVDNQVLDRFNFASGQANSESFHEETITIKVSKDGKLSYYILKKLEDDIKNYFIDRYHKFYKKDP
jgi:hypothetical protein